MISEESIQDNDIIRVFNSKDELALKALLSLYIPFCHHQPLNLIHPFIPSWNNSIERRTKMP